MSKLEPLIATLVDDLLGCIREAALEGLHQALETQIGERQNAAFRSPKADRFDATRMRPKRAVRTPARRTMLATSVETPEPPDAAAITNPEAVLAGVHSSRKPFAPAEASEREAVASPPESDSSPTAAPSVVIPLPIRLREGESVLRSSGAGVVLRRARSA